MVRITPPKYVKHIMITLQARGHAVCLVGGCVRDMILGVQPQDWDICTSALPGQVMEIFPNSRPTGLKHGTVTVIENSKSVEVTTFRSEGAYTDHRHPDSVSFVGDLTADLSRRDFTMNAIAVHTDGLVSDPFGGMDDIKNQLIRCVGNPEKRFEEDALRMFRAIRFSARLGFEIETETRAAIVKKAPLAAALAAERVRDETEKILLTKQPELIFDLISTGLLDRYLLHRLSDGALLRRISALPRKALPRWAAFCRILQQSGCISSPTDFLLSLRLDHPLLCRLCRITGAGPAGQQRGVETAPLPQGRGHRDLRCPVQRRAHRRREPEGAESGAEKRRVLFHEASGRHGG